MLLSPQLFDRIVGLSAGGGRDPHAKATVLPAGCRRAAERRAATRLAYGHRTQICRDAGGKAGVWGTVMLQDISLKGIGFLCDDPIGAGETFVLKLMDKEGESIRIRCTVRRCERGGFGNTAYLLGASFEQVIQHQPLQINDDERDLPEGREVEDNTVPEADAVVAASPGFIARLVTRLLRAIDPSRLISPWSRKADDFS